jgi:hypothetical protein
VAVLPYRKEDIIFLYIRLILAHFIGDFLLQFDKLYALKFKHISGVVLHTLIIYCCLITFSWPYLDQGLLWAFLTGIALLHFVQDWAKIRFTKNSEHNLFFFVLDQILHVSLLAVMFLTPLRNNPAPLNKHHNILISLYNNNFLLIFITAAIISSYMGYFVIPLFKQDYLKMKSSYTAFERNYGFIERFLLTSILLFKSWLPFWILPILVLRPLFAKIIKKEEMISSEFASGTEIILSASYSILIGLLFRAFV